MHFNVFYCAGFIVFLMSFKTFKTPTLFWKNIHKKCFLLFNWVSRTWFCGNLISRISAKLQILLPAKISSDIALDHYLGLLCNILFYFKVIMNIENMNVSFLKNSFLRARLHEKSLTGLKIAELISKFLTVHMTTSLRQNGH